MKSYTVGFIFSDNLEYVYLIRKTHPEWQAGLLNGVGGHVGGDESWNDCMARESEEEAGYTGIWKYYASMGGQGWECAVYYSVMQAGQNEPETRTEEQIEKVSLVDIISRAPQMIPNLPWLILAAVNHYYHGVPGFYLDVKYK